jgi:hypothetical protein
MRELLLVGAGLAPERALDAFVRLRDLQDAGSSTWARATWPAARASPGRGGAAGSVPIVEPAIDLTPPPAPGGFAATGGTTQILFETAAPVYRQGHGHSRTKIYAAPVGRRAAAHLRRRGALHRLSRQHRRGALRSGELLRLWATWTSVDGVESQPAGGTNGIAAATGLLEDQHIANLAVGKLLAGSLSVGQYIQSADYVAGVSGWRIQTLAGGGAFMEINGGAKIGGVSLFVNGTNVKTAQSMGMHVILSPSGGYTIQASASGGQDLVVMVCKR